ncbi:uncharacterized protein LOC110336049 [Mus pahari]|uniref:uncharacterized protein LOC110336049 n=1 Tax=Mus pahari TaxID=10093 RepID=UPI000A306E2E|nr:uncharacterized protein LOC110336049 [Mus pahari]
MEWHGHVPWPVSHWASDFGEILSGRRTESQRKKERKNRIKALLRVPKQNSVWGLMAWPRPSPEQARWWEDLSLPPLHGPCLCSCRLSSKRRLHPLPPMTSCPTPKTLPSLASREESSLLTNQPMMEPLSASRLKMTKAVPRLRPKVSPKRSTMPKTGQQQTPMSMWPPIIINPQSKSSALKGQHTPSDKEVTHTPSACGNPLPHLPSK